MTSHHPHHRLRTVSRRAVQSDRAAGRRAGAPAPSGFAGVRRVAHVFRVSYEAVDRELPAAARARAAGRAGHVRPCDAHQAHAGRNPRAQCAHAHACADAGGPTPDAGTIVPDAPRSAAAARAGAAAAHGGAVDRRAGRALARRRALSLQLSVLAGGRGRRRRRRPAALAAFIHVPRVSRVPAAAHRAGADRDHARRSDACRRSDRAGGARRGALERLATASR